MIPLMFIQKNSPIIKKKMEITMRNYIIKKWIMMIKSMTIESTKKIKNNKLMKANNKLLIVKQYNKMN